MLTSTSQLSNPLSPVLPKCCCSPRARLHHSFTPLFIKQRAAQAQAQDPADFPRWKSPPGVMEPNSKPFRPARKARCRWLTELKRPRLPLGTSWLRQAGRDRPSPSATQTPGTGCAGREPHFASQPLIKRWVSQAGGFVWGARTHGSRAGQLFAASEGSGGVTAPRRGRSRSGPGRGARSALVGTGWGRGRLPYRECLLAEIKGEAGTLFSGEKRGSVSWNHRTTRLEKTFKMIESNRALTPQLNHATEWHIQIFFLNTSRDDDNWAYCKAFPDIYAKRHPSSLSSKSSKLEEKPRDGLVLKHISNLCIYDACLSQNWNRTTLELTEWRFLFSCLFVEIVPQNTEFSVFLGL